MRAVFKTWGCAGGVAVWLWVQSWAAWATEAAEPAEKGEEHPAAVVVAATNAASMEAAEISSSNKTGSAEKPQPISEPSATNGASKESPKPVLINKTDSAEKPRHISSEIHPTSNIKIEADAGGIPDYEIKMGLARTQRRNGDYEPAEKDYLFVINSRAPDSMKKDAFSELAAMCEGLKQYVKAQRIYSEWMRMFPEDVSMPEVLLRQGLLYREMGANTRALAKFYSVMSSALSSKDDRVVDYYKKLVLRAQTEIAETYYLDGKYLDASEKFKLLLKLESPDLNRGVILFKLIRCLYSMEAWADVIARSETYLNGYPDSADQAEVRFLLASSLKKMGRTSDSLAQVTLLLQNQKKLAMVDPDKWRYWQQRTGNEIGNQLYQEGDFVNALLVYNRLAELDASPSWQLPVLYQIGLVYEQLKQPEKAAEVYGRILGRKADITSGKFSALQTVLDMAKWRQNRLSWQSKAEQVEKDFGAAAPQPETAPAPATTPSPAPETEKK
jgi:tetratricopeptide (TPR) repeat protein